jgi:hypothetical protein
MGASFRPALGAAGTPTALKSVLPLRLPMENFDFDIGTTTVDRGAEAIPRTGEAAAIDRRWNTNLHISLRSAVICRSGHYVSGGINANRHEE